MRGSSAVDCARKAFSISATEVSTLPLTGKLAICAEGGLGPEVVRERTATKVNRRSVASAVAGTGLQSHCNQDRTELPRDRIKPSWTKSARTFAHIRAGGSSGSNSAADVRRKSKSASTAPQYSHSDACARN